MCTGAGNAAPVRRPPTGGRRALSALIAAATFSLSAGVAAEPLRPQSDSEVVEVLGSAGPARAEEREMRRRLRADPGNATLAVALARRYFEQAREQGEPRHAGRAIALLEPWQPFDRAPADVVLMMATLQQHLHDFDGSSALLEQLVQRAPGHAQAWLTLATVRRVQGRYAASDAACKALLDSGAALHGRACQAENLALRGEFDAARRRFDALLAIPDLTPPTRAWLFTSVAEMETRAGRARAAEAAFRAALAAEPDEYARLAYADFLLANNRAAEVPALLREAARSDPVLLRLAQAATARRAPDASAAELRARIAQAGIRPQAQATHAREQALFALDVERDPQRALALAQVNVKHQREPIDLLLLARAARAARDEAALQQAAALGRRIGLRDARLDALL